MPAAVPKTTTANVFLFQRGVKDFFCVPAAVNASSRCVFIRQVHL